MSGSRRIRLLAPPINPAQFLRETLDSREYARTHRPDGSRYDRGLHGGYDFSRDPADDHIYAACDGIIRHINLGAAYGLQLAIRDQQNGYQASCFYAHLRERARDGLTVAAGTPIGRIGDTGNTSGPHLHFETHSRHGDRHSIYDPISELQHLQEEARMPLNQEDKLWIEQALKRAVRTAVNAIGWGYNSEGDDWLPDDDTWRAAVDANNLKQLRRLLPASPPARPDIVGAVKQALREGSEP